MKEAQPQPLQIAVVGGGPWGLGLAAAAARAGAATLIHSRRQLGSALPAGVRQAPDLAAIGREARLVVLAVPSDVAAEVARRLGEVLDGRHLLVHGIRGLAGVRSGELATVSDVLRRETPARRIGALGGPALSEELLEGRPGVLVCGSYYPEVNRAVSRAFTSSSLRVYETADLRGLEWASALVGCLAVGVGYGQGVGLSAGIQAALISRGIEEAARIAAAAGGEERTLLGLAGYGDLLASIAQRDRPEVVVGAALARGRTIAEALGETKLRVEAIELIPRLAAWAAERRVPTPIFQALASALSGPPRPPQQILQDLMTSPQQRLS